MRSKAGSVAGLGAASVVMMESAVASPGGTIAWAAFEMPMAAAVLGLLMVAFLPLLGLIRIRERLAERRARSDLAFMARTAPHFEWLNIQDRARDCFTRIHEAWHREDLSDVAGHLTEWYRQNQQVVSLDRWKREGLVNRCEVKKMGEIKPLLFIHRNDDRPHQGSRLVLSITANMQDYLLRWDSGKVIQGSKKYRDIETIWSFVLENGLWRVANIEEDAVASTYAKLVRELPRIEETLLPGPAPGTQDRIPFR